MKERDPLFFTTLEHLCECSQQGQKPRVLPVPVTTAYNAKRLSKINKAAPHLVQSNPYGLCVFVAYNTDEKRVSGDEDFITTAIAYYPRMLAQLAEGKNPKFCDTALLSILKKNGVDYRPTGLMSDMTPAVADELELLRDTKSGKHYRQLRWHRGSDHVNDRFEISDEFPEEDCCIICFKAKPTYKWSECNHPTHNAQPMVCLHCRNAIHTDVRERAARNMKQQQQRNGDPNTPCPICRTPGRMTKWTKQCSWVFHPRRSR